MIESIIAGFVAAFTLTNLLFIAAGTSRWASSSE